MIGNPLLLGIDAQVDPPPSGDPTFDFSTGMPTGTSIARTGNAIYCTSAQEYVIAGSNVPRRDFDPSGVFAGLMLEPAYTNKAAGENFNPQSSANWTGATGAELVADAAALAAAGLDGLVPSGNVLRVVGDGPNSNNNGQTGNTNVHSMCVFARVDPATASPGSVGRFQMWDGIGQTTFENGAYEVVRSDAFTPGGGDSRIRLGNTPSPGGARWCGATLVEDSQSPAYPIPGNAATQGQETLSIAQAQLPDGDYNIVFDTPNGQFTLYEQTIAGGWSITGAAFRALCDCARVRKITFTAPSPDPGPGPTGDKRMFGLWGLNGSADAGIPPANFQTLTVAPVRGWVWRVPWWRIETGRNQHDWSLVDASMVAADQKAQELGYDFKVINYLEVQCWATLQADPYTAGPPAYIVNNPDEFGGASNGPGGMWPNNSNPNYWRTSRHHPAFIDRHTELLKRYIDRYGNNPACHGVCINESALGFSVAGNTPSGQEFNSLGGGNGYFDRQMQQLTDLANYGVPFVVLRQTNFWNGARGGNRQANEALVQHLYGLNQQIGKDLFHFGVPDSVGDSSSQGYSSVYAGFRDAINAGFTAPGAFSLQWAQYTASTPPNNPYSLVDCTDLAVYDFSGQIVAQWPRVASRNDANDWNDVVQIYQDRDTGGPNETQAYIDFLHRSV